MFVWSSFPLLGEILKPQWNLAIVFFTQSFLFSLAAENVNLMRSDRVLFLQNESRRTRVEIIATIISLAEKGESHAGIAEKANLNSKQMKRYLKELIRLGLLEIEDESNARHYVSTKRGTQYLRRYRKLREILT